MASANYNELTDKRIQHVLNMNVHTNVDGSADSKGNTYATVNGKIIPYGAHLLSYVNDFYATAGDITLYYADRLKNFPEKNGGQEIPENKEIRAKLLQELEAQLEVVKKLEAEKEKFKGFHAMAHPYAIMHLPGSIESNTNYAVDKANRRRWYETDGGTSIYLDGERIGNFNNNWGHYAKNPTTTSIINWGKQDERGRFPYMYQDFVFSKYWNRISNNRMITLRRYPAPTTDNVEPADYVNDGSTGYKSDRPFAPLATAITYFGEGTSNKLSDILKFTVGYEWEEMKNVDPWHLSSEQNDNGDIFGPGGGSWLSGGAGFIAQAMGIMGSLNGDGGMNAEYAKGLPPDPYEQGNMYENRIMGPVNVINNVYKRKRGLKFSGDGLTIQFDYVARPISNVNTKAVMLDILANILIMTSATGTWFGGIQRYRTERPAVFPMSKDIHNKLYSGQILGPNGVFREMFTSLVSKSNNTWNNFFSSMMDSVGQAAKDLFNGVKHLANGMINQNDSKKDEGRGDINNAGDNLKDAGNQAKQAATQAGSTLNQFLTAKLTQGANVPWITGLHALLTGDPVGDWHLTIGNPLNPIAMIGNLIMDSCDIKFYDELGPDDFPIGFTATIKLKHGMGRDRDAIESMFNKGCGRIYTLPDTLKSSADFETTVDNYTGVNNEYANANANGEIKYDGLAARTQVSEADLIYGSNTGGKLSNSGSDSAYRRNLYDMNIKTAMFGQKDTLSSYATYKMQPWTARYTM